MNRTSPKATNALSEAIAIVHTAWVPDLVATASPQRARSMSVIRIEGRWRRL